MGGIANHGQRPVISLSRLVLVSYVLHTFLAGVALHKKNPTCNSSTLMACAFQFDLTTFSGCSCITKKIILSCLSCAWMIFASLIWFSFMIFSCNVCTVKHNQYMLALCLDVMSFLKLIEFLNFLLSVDSRQSRLCRL